MRHGSCSFDTTQASGTCTLAHGKSGGSVSESLLLSWAYVSVG